MNEEEKRINEFSEQFGYPIFTAAQAIRASLSYLGVRKIALFAPYPDWAVKASQAYWQHAGFYITDTKTVSLDTTDTRHVYRIRTEMVLESVKNLNWESADAVLLTGTGVPTLRAMKEINKQSRKPVLSSNLCLAWYLMKQLSLDHHLPSPDHGESLYGGWSTRIRA
jgi:maleate isomerase